MSELHSTSKQEDFLEFHNWTVISTKCGELFKWRCRCRCGTIRNVDFCSILDGKSQSCGCVSRVRPKKDSPTPMMAKVRYTWKGMIGRCKPSASRKYKRYAGRGIAVCGRWLSSFENFLFDMGEPPTKSHSIDRINNDLGYWCGKSECPECGPRGNEPNCRWATRTQQQNNKMTNVNVKIGDETRTISEWSRVFGIDRRTVHSRMRILGWDAEKAVTTPVHKNKDIDKTEPGI